MLRQNWWVVPFGIIATEIDDGDEDAGLLPPQLTAPTPPPPHEVATKMATTARHRFMCFAPRKARVKGSRKCVRYRP